jgi:predicted nucleic-acid-binding protein
MIGLDTNVLIGYLLRDDEAQFQVALGLITKAVASGETVLLGSLVLLETEWVLRSRYGFQKVQILRMFEMLLETRKLGFDDERAFELAVHSWKNSSAEFADCLILANYLKAGCERVVTFDRKASSLPGAMLL